MPAHAAHRCGACDPDSAEGFERLLMRVSQVFSGARWDRVGAEIDSALGDVLVFCKMDQAWLFEVLRDNESACLRHLACTPGSAAVPKPFAYADRFPSAFRVGVREGKVVAVERIEDLPQSSAADTVSMREFGLRAMLHLPLRIDGEVRFGLVIGCNRSAVPWTQRCAMRLTAIGQIFAHAISRAEAVGALVASGHDAGNLLDIAHAGRWEWDIGADKLSLSDEAKHTLGAAVPTLAQFMVFVDPSDRPVLQRAIDAARAQPGKRFHARYVVRTPAGETRAIQQWHEVIFPGERTARLMATVQDVTASKASERELTELRAYHWHSARVGQTTLLVASLAHELSQPLAAILNNAQAGLRFLGSGKLGPQDTHDILSDIVASNKRAAQVLGALRAMLRRQHTTRVTFDAADAMQDVLTLVRSELMSEQIELASSIERGCFLNADKTQIEQVLLNLIMNSIDALRAVPGEGRCLSVAARSTEKGDVEITVSDSGVGIPAEKLGRVFEAFWTTKNKGLGVGLQVCRTIVESYGGRIWCEHNDASGVTFRFTLPSAAQEDRIELLPQ